MEKYVIFFRSINQSEDDVLFFNLVGIRYLSKDGIVGCTTWEPE